MAGVKHTFSVNIADDASAIAAGMVLPSHWNAEHTLSGVAAQADLDTLSNAVSALSAAHASLVDRVSANSGVGGGGGSVTSNEMSILVAAESAGRVSADNALSNAISAVSQQLSLQASALSTRIDSVGTAINTVSNALSNEISNRISAVNVVSNAASNALSVANAVSNKASALSVVIAANSAQMTSADNAISNAVSVVSVAAANATSIANAVSNKASSLSVNLASVDARVTSAVDRISANSGQMTSADNAISNAVSIVSVAQAATSADLTSVKNVLSALNSAHNALSNTVSGLGGGGASVTSAEYLSLVNRVSANSGTGGGGSVTSNELSAAVTASVFDNSAGASTTGKLQSVVNVIANNRDLLEVIIFANLSAVSAAHDSLVNRVSANSGAGGGGSVTSNELSAAAAGLSIRVDSVFNAVSIVSNAASNALSVANAASNAASIVSVAAANALSVANAASNKASALSVVIAGNSAQMTSADNALSNAISILSAAHTSLVDRVSANSGGSVTSDELSAAAQGLSLRIDSAFGAASNNASVASNAASVAVAAKDLASNYASAASNYASAASHYASVASAAALALLAPQIRIVSNTQSTAGSALVDISGLVLTVAADQTWEVNGLLMMSTSAATVGLKVGTSVPPLSLPRFINFRRYSAGQSAGILGGGGLLQVSGASQQLSAANAGGVLFGVKFDGIFNVASAGTFRLMYAGMASTAASPIHIMAGSYMKAIRLK